jgi:glycine hydroxymethyltransferase
MVHMLEVERQLGASDPELYAALSGERRRQEEFLELIASENYVSPAVLYAQGSALTNKYADGYPGRRTYSGCEFVDVAERLAIERAKRLFGAAYANVQPYSGSSANAAVYAALMQPGDTLLGMHAGHGGHITHGDDVSFAGQLYDVVQYGLGSDGWIDYEQAARLARQHRPKVMVAGFSAYSRIVDWQRFRQIADDIGAYFVADMAHVSGLVAAGLYPNPVPIADVTTTTTHKTLRGPRGGMILAPENAALAARLDAAVYPGQQGGPLMHVVAAKAVALAEAAQPAFADYQREVIDNARILAGCLMARGYEVVTGGTDNHMLLVDLSSHGIGAAEAERALEEVHIASNAIRLPGAAEGVAGLRLGTPAVTTRGLDKAEIAELAHAVADVLQARDDAAVAARVRAAVLDLCRAHPVYGPGL